MALPDGAARARVIRCAADAVGMTDGSGVSWQGKPSSSATDASAFATLTDLLDVADPANRAE